ncbi:MULTISPECIES: hypothetical protein [unclassified Sphingomonas]|uniref:hypothetical protein n=1 Tax=unclassified Sphingomonas TaxID=196159 RepID=UPI0006FDDBF1|nr:MULTISPECIES: hypothetical protein [unclassified Sphingomonas]KQM64687.1 hypothetical protein ASE65_15570 [Sphingomonas sp. Leaf16]KQN16819.1 hypothetical protein ASE81_15620 [Sphingomonas sp. Leaf29]KQN22802.1 hypothetical protein ASE83_15550 [Sphingomonas sp. Leaf32]
MTHDNIPTPKPPTSDSAAWEGALQAFRFAQDAKKRGDALDYQTALTNLIATPAPNSHALGLKLEAMFAEGDISPERRAIILDDLRHIDSDDAGLRNAWRDYMAALTLSYRASNGPQDMATSTARMDVADTVLLNTDARTKAGVAVKLRRALVGLHRDRFVRLALHQSNAELAEQIGDIDDTPARLIASAIVTLEANG